MLDGFCWQEVAAAMGHGSGGWSPDTSAAFVDALEATPPPDPVDDQKEIQASFCLLWPLSGIFLLQAILSEGRASSISSASAPSEAEEGGAKAVAFGGVDLLAPVHNAAHASRVLRYKRGSGFRHPPGHSKKAMY